MPCTNQLAADPEASTDNAEDYRAVGLPGVDTAPCRLLASTAWPKWDGIFPLRYSAAMRVVGLLAAVGFAEFRCEIQRYTR